mgnify:CR=1 FL=1
MKRQKLPKLVRFVLINSVIGIVIGWMVAGLLVWANLGGFGSLVLNSANRAAAIFILAMSFGVTFGFGFLTTAVLLLPTDKDSFDRM